MNYYVYYNKSPDEDKLPWVVFCLETGVRVFARKIVSNANTTTVENCDVPGCAKFVIHYVDCRLSLSDDKIAALSRISE